MNMHRRSIRILTVAITAFALPALADAAVVFDTSPGRYSVHAATQAAQVTSNGWGSAPVLTATISRARSSNILEVDVLASGVLPAGAGSHVQMLVRVNGWAHSAHPYRPATQTATGWNCNDTAVNPCAIRGSFFFDLSGSNNITPETFSIAPDGELLIEVYLQHLGGTITPVPTMDVTLSARLVKQK